MAIDRDTDAERRERIEVIVRESQRLRARARAAQHAGQMAIERSAALLRVTAALEATKIEAPRVVTFDRLRRRRA